MARSKEEYLEYQRRYREEHKEELKRKAREKYANCSKTKETRKRWREKNKEKVKAYRKEYYKEYRQKHPYYRRSDDMSLIPPVDNVFEIWAEIEGTDKRYYVSNQGRIWSRKRGIVGHKNGLGYYTISIDGKQYFVHRLVGKAFVPNPNNYPEIDHIDTDKANNVWTNLRWTDRKGNQNNPVTIEKFKANGSNNFGDSFRRDKPVVQYSLEGGFLVEYDSIEDAAKMTGINRSSIGGCCNNRQYTAGGFKWDFVKKGKTLCKSAS